MSGTDRGARWSVSRWVGHDGKIARTGPRSLTTRGSLTSAREAVNEVTTPDAPDMKRGPSYVCYHLGSSGHDVLSQDASYRQDYDAYGWNGYADDMHVRPNSLVPELGENTEEILLETLGYSWEDIGTLPAEGVIL